MARQVQPVGAGTVKTAAIVDVVAEKDVALVTITGFVDEHFGGFGNFGDGIRTIVISVGGMTRMTSFGVRQWLRSMDALPKTISDIYLLGSPTFFVDQLNMVLNFGGSAQILSVVAPYTCPSCGMESGETIDVLAERATLVKGAVPVKECRRCGGKLEFDETPESYFSFVSKYVATSIQPDAAELLKQRGLYTTTAEIAGEKPPRIIKLIHGAVTYFRIIGSIGAMFRARPLLVGAEGEVVIDLAEVQSFDALAQREWRRLIKNLASQVPTVTLVDINESFLTGFVDSLSLARNVAVWSISVPFRCTSCGRTSHESVPINRKSSPFHFGDRVCSMCGGTMQAQLTSQLLAPLQRATTSTPPASAKVIGQRDEILSRALTDANVANAGEGATAALNADDTILGKYKIVRKLSSGGMAEVFLARQVGIGGFEKPVALKRINRQLLEQRHQAIDMFLNEAKIAGRLTHPNIVQVLDVGEVNGALYLAMEYVRGKDLSEIVKRLNAANLTIALGDALLIVREVAQALHYAYWSTDLSGQRLAVVHRDVSPHNVIVGFDGSVRLLDFGVAVSNVTEANNMIAGKWMYMSPEHTTNEQLDHRSDLFSLGVILYLLCVGKTPFAGSDAKDIVRKIRSGHYIPLQQAAPDLPQQISQLVTSMLATDPAQRPQSGREVVTVLTEMSRSYGIESSTTNLATLMQQLFGDEIPEDDMFGGGARQPQRPSEIEAYAIGANGMPSAIDNRVSGAYTAEPPRPIPQPFAYRAASPVHNPNFTPELSIRSESRWLTFAVAVFVIVLGVAMYFLVQPH